MARRTSKTGRAVAVIGGAAVLVWLFSHRRGHRSAGAPGVNAGEPCWIHVGPGGIELEGRDVDLPTALTRCRAAGAAEVTAAGDALVGSIAEVLAALERAGIAISARPDLWGLAALAGPARSAP